MSLQIDAIHKSPFRVVMVITGGGAEVIGDLLKHGNGSATLLEAIVPYSETALEDFIGGKPDKSVHPDTARAMAAAAYRRAVHLSDGKDVIGIGATSKLAKANERKDRSHEIYIAAQNDSKTAIVSVKLDSGRSREEEESLTATVILNVLAQMCGVTSAIAPPQKALFIRSDFGELVDIRESVLNPATRELFNGKTNKIRVCFDKEKPESIVKFPGSFSRLHKNHIAMAKHASEKYGQPVDFEISIFNPDKPPLDYITIEDRLSQFEAYKDEPWFGSVWLTNSPLFAQKADLFPGSVFIVGYDTLVRISNPNYYLPHEFDAVMESLKQKAKFLAFHRVNVDVSVDPILNGLAEIVSPEFYEDDGTSSTKIRKGNVNS